MPSCRRSIRSFCIVLLSAAAALLVARCASRPAALPARPANAPHVEAWEPTTPLSDLHGALRVRFDRPMVGSEVVGPTLAAAPVQVSPALQLQAHWEDPRTLVLRPQDAFHSGDRYHVQLTGALADAMGKTSLDVDVEPLQLQWLGIASHNAAHEPKFSAGFSRPVHTQDVVQHCVLASPKHPSTALRLQGKSSEDPSTRVLLEVTTPLALDTDYRLACPGLLPVSGSAPFYDAPSTEGFRTHGPFQLLTADPAAGPALPPEQARLCLSFSTPLDDAQLAAHVHVTPEPKGLADHWYRTACRSDGQNEDRASSLLLDARSHYQVTLDAALTDSFGQALGHEHRFAFDTSDRVPGLWTATGVMPVLERGRAGLAVGSLNLDAVNVRCAKVTPSALPARFDDLRQWVLASYENEAYQSEHGNARPDAFALLQVKARTAQLGTTMARNAAGRWPLDLGQLCGAHAGAAGLYVVETSPTPALAHDVRQGDDPARLLANVTDLAVVAKRGEHSALAWVSRFSDGSLVAGANVRVLDRSGRQRAQARTDATGLVRFAQLPPGGDDEDLYFVVETADDVAVVGTSYLWQEGLSGWQLGVQEAWEDDGKRLFVHTDRGVYRPGEKVLVHGLVRQLHDGSRATVPADRAVRIELQADGDLVAERNLKLSDFGSFSTTIELPAAIAPGTHALNITAAGAADTHHIQVADFRPVTFEITGGPDHDEVMAGQRVQLPIETRYLSGAKLPRAKLQWTVQRDAAAVCAPADFSEFNFADDAPALEHEEAWPEEPSGVVDNPQGTTDADGKAQLAFDTQAVRSPGRYTVTVEARDEGEDRVSRSFSVLAHSADRYVGTHMNGWLVQEGQPIQAQLVVIDRNGRRVSGDVDVELRSVSWACPDPLDECRSEVKLVQQQHLHVSADAVATASFAQHVSGSVYVRATVQDAKGRRARASDSAWVLGQDEGAAPYAQQIAATLATDKRRYAVGGRAQLALQTARRPAHYLLTSERADILDAKVSDGKAPPFLDLGASSAPNAFLTMTGMVARKGPGRAGAPQLVAGVKEVQVESQTRVLRTQIDLAAETFQPGEHVTGKVKVTHLGQPVLAEVALVVVNESVLQLTGFRTPDPTAVFQRQRKLGVHTVSNVPRVMADPAAAADVPTTTATVGEQGTDGGGGAVEVRDDYVAAAYFAPDLRTDAHGELSFAFDAPSDLSAYRVMVVAAAKDDRVGSADKRLRVRMPLSVRALLPRFASRGDQLELGALVHDDTGVVGPVSARLHASGFSLDATTLEAASNGAGSQVMRTAGSVADVDSAVFDIEIHKAAHADRVRHTLPVRRPLDTDLRVLGAARARSLGAELRYPEAAISALSELQITVDRAGLAPLAPLLVQVVKYPFGCTEQTLSALSAMLATPELASAVLPEVSTAAALRARVLEGQALLLRARTSDGNFALYPGMTGRPWLTALTLQVSLAMAAAGYEVSQHLLAGASEALRSWVKSQPVAALQDEPRALAALTAQLWSRMGTPDEGLEDELWAVRSSLDDDSLAQLLLAWAGRSVHADRRAQLVERFAAASWLGAQRDALHPLRSAQATTGLVLNALAAANAPEAQQLRLAQWLLARAQDHDAWFSTRDIAEILGGLGAWAKHMQGGQTRVQVGHDNVTLYDGTLQGAQVLWLHRSATELASAQLWVKAQAEVSIAIRRKDVRASQPAPAFSRGFSLKRRYLDPKTGAELRAVKLGDLVQVVIELSTEQPVPLLALTDPLPAGLEPLDPNLATGNLAGCADCDSASWGFDHVRRRDDRIEAFAEHLAAGTHTIRYLLRATIPGSFSAPGAEALPMYSPNLFARSEVGRVQITH